MALGIQAHYAAQGPDLGQLVQVTVAVQTSLEERNLSFPALNDGDWVLLRQYMNGNKLLLDCLHQAVVADREAIKYRLLLLPPE